MGGLELPKDNMQVASFVKPSTKPNSDAEKGRETKKRTARRAPTPKQIKAAKLMAENVSADKPKPQGEILAEAGYSKTIQKAPSRIIQADSFQDLLDSFLPDNDLAEVHKRLLQTRKLEHMVFPLWQGDEEFIPLEGDIPEDARVTNGEMLTDDDIVDMLADVNCKVRKIVHGDQARHVYFWTHDANAQTKALELAYKMKGHMGKDGGGDGTAKILALFGNNTVNFLKGGKDDD